MGRMFKKQLKFENGINFESFIGPWVLPNEEIPVHLTWDYNFEFNKILIEFPSDLIFIELINAVYKTKNNSKIVIEKQDIKHLGHGTHPNFIGIIFIYKEFNFIGLKQFHDIKFKFLNKSGEIVKNIMLTAKIFRPKLKNISEIQPIQLTDNENDYTVDINLIYEGFGIVSIKLEPEINKSKIPFDQPIFEKVIENLEVRYITYLEAQKTQSDIQESEIEIDDEKVSIFIDLLKKFNEDKFTRETDIGNLMKDNNIEGVLISDFYNELIKELRLRYRYENVILNNPNVNIPQEKFYDIIHSSKILIHYKDLNENIYEPVEIDLNLKDHRSDFTKTKINFKIQIKKITDNAFKDIERVRRNKID
ncbi:hypothetical protein ES703_80422 [subsurface metagenome]